MLTDHSTKTSERILQAAFTVLSKQGYEHTSIKDIAEEAGVAQGLIHYYFKSKQQLVLEVLAFVCDKVESGAAGEAGALQAFAQTKAMLRDPATREANALYVQLIGVSLHDEAIGNGVRNFVTADRAHIEDIARQVLGEREQDPRPARRIAGVVWAAVLGIMIQGLVDPQFDTDEAIDTLAEMSLSATFGGGN